MPIVLFVENNIDNLNEQTAITFLIGCARKTVEFDQYCLNGSIEPICCIRLFFKRAFFQIIQFSINWCNKYFCFCKPVFLWFKQSQVDFSSYVKGFKLRLLIWTRNYWREWIFMMLVSTWRSILSNMS